MIVRSENQHCADGSWSSRLGVLQVSGVEALSEPVVDFCEDRMRLVASIGVAQQSREAGRRMQL